VHTKFDIYVVFFYIFTEYMIFLLLKFHDLILKNSNLICIVCT